MEKNESYYGKKCALDSFWVKFWVKYKSSKEWKFNSYSLLIQYILGQILGQTLQKLSKYNVSINIP